ncbi:PaaI family thioesterase [Syntrophorhabdus aromaticivorans]|uniref:Thioesterase domain-containing protein n=1 Tax=Syntrophorhabdus aromaticivorans TaxID=328301 RepID=A0A971M819_9BACT|nr:hotdog domain-containing protein [Syntrophorhabdus aromaticivorans]NLW36836.1 hypothetical protein [Syntrophorhabdus aromaticivorans]
MNRGALPIFKASFFLNQKRRDGLKLRVIYAGDHVYTDFRLSNGFQSETNSLYGGIFFGIMDVLMWYAILMEARKICMTKKITVDFFEPLLCGAPYRAKSKLMNVNGKNFYVTAWTEDANGEVCTKVDALFREGKNISMADILRDFDFSETTPEMEEFFSTFS